MKSIFTIILFGISLTIQGQTKKETQDWIGEKIELFSYSNEYDVFNDYSVSYQGDEIVIKNFHKNITNDIEVSFTTTYYIPIKEMSKIRFEEKSSNTWMFIKIKGGSKSIKKVYESSGTSKYSNEVEILLEKSIGEDNIKNRLIKAFNHLIKLYGGTVVEEKF